MGVGKVAKILCGPNKKTARIAEVSKFCKKKLDWEKVGVVFM